MSTVSACPACAAVPLIQSVAANNQPPNIYLSLPGIHCAVCIGKVERALSGMSEITDARVNLSLKRVAIIGSPSLSTEAIVEVLQTIGFEALPLDAAALAPSQDALAQELLTRLAVAGFAMMNVMLLSVAVWSGAADATRDLFHMISAAIALPVVSYAGQPFFKSAWAALKVRALNMDVPISLAIILAAGMSLFETLNGGGHAYFDAALSLTFFLLIGRYLDQKTRSSAQSAARELTALEAHSAQKLMNGQTISVAVSELCLGDSILVPTGVRVPVDGTLSSPAALTDRSFLTGESATVALAAGAPVQAGEINLGAPFELVATAVGEDTTLRRVSALVQMAENSRNTYTALADKAAQIYAPAVHLLALAAFVVWVWLSGDFRLSLNIAIAVLIITCPCALGLAVPAVTTAAIGKLYSMGFLVKNATALERLAEVDTVVFDKTGTLTVPGSDIDLSALTSREKTIARTLAQASLHPVSQAIAKALGNQDTVQLHNVAEITGCGVQGYLGAQRVRLGKASWLGAEFDAVGLQIGDNAATQILVVEKLRDGAVEAVSKLKEAGMDVKLLSGDASDKVEIVANTLGISSWTSDLSAEEKYACLQDMAQRNKTVVMIGDGLNDAASLAVAHAGIAPATALDASRTVADIVVLRESFTALPGVFKIAKAVTRLSKQNFLIAAIYNAVAVPIALLGYATPLVAALAMSASSITVLLNALRVRNTR